MPTESILYIGAALVLLVCAIGTAAYVVRPKRRIAPPPKPQVSPRANPPPADPDDGGDQ